MTNLRSQLESWLKLQFERIPATPTADPGSYYRGYDNGMQDILRGLKQILDNPAEERSLQAPIAKIKVEEIGWKHPLVTAELYAPGLPPGEHDVYCEPASGHEPKPNATPGATSTGEPSSAREGSRPRELHCIGYTPTLSGYGVREGGPEGELIATFKRQEDADGYIAGFSD